MCYALVCELSERTAAIAPVAGGIVTEDCHPSRLASVMHFHAKQDPGWPYSGGQNCWSDSRRPPISDTIATWVRLSDCHDGPQVT